MSSSQAEGHDYSEVVHDFVKLSAILDAAEDHYKGQPLPAAFVGILGNHRRRFDLRRLFKRLASESIRPDIELLFGEPHSSTWGTLAQLQKQMR